MPLVQRVFVVSIVVAELEGCDIIRFGNGSTRRKGKGRGRGGHDRRMTIGATISGRVKMIIGTPAATRTSRPRISKGPRRIQTDFC
jgi:hypothetical protein